MLVISSIFSTCLIILGSLLFCLSEPPDCLLLSHTPVPRQSVLRDRLCCAAPHLPNAELVSATPPRKPTGTCQIPENNRKIKEVRSACQDKRSMLSILEQPRPRAGSKRTGFNALLDAPSSPYVNISNARYYTPRSLSLPTPSPSPSRLPSVSPASSSSMLSVRSHPDALDALFRHPQQRSQGSVVLKPCSSPLFETFSSDELPCANAPPSFEFTYDDEQPEPAPPFSAPESENNTSASAAFNAFRVTKSRVLRVSFPPCYSCLLSFPLFTPYLRPLASCVV